MDKRHKRIVNPCARNLRGVSPDHRKAIMQEKLCDWAVLCSSQGLIVTCADPELFECLSLETYEFAELGDGKVALQTPTLMRRIPGGITRSLEYSCHRIAVGARRYKYLRLDTHE